jgi:quinohemoprotein ethanol dehydrogenase
MLRDAGRSGEEWLTIGRDYAETRFSPLKQIDASNVSRLGLAWTFDTGSYRGLEATPLVKDGVLYATASWSVVFALDARTGKELWRWDPQADKAKGRRACCDVVNRGVALYQGKVYVGVIDGRLAALDAKDGKVVWQVQTTPEDEDYTITGAPRIVKGKVIIGNGGAEMGVRGFVSAYDAGTGKLVWRFYTVPGDPSKPFENPAMEAAAKTWTGEWWKFGGGGTVWDGMAYDPEADLLYVGTGNGSPWNRDVRSPGGGDNLYLSSILALRPDSGELVWHYQTTPGDTWDYTAVQPLLLADLNLEGRPRKVIMQAPKNGFFYVLDRLTGELISADAFSRVTWATGVDKATGRPIEVPGARYEKGVVLLTPGPLGAHNWDPMSFNPATGLVYIPTQDASFPYSRDAQFKFQKGKWNLSVAFAPRGTPQPPAGAAPPGSPGTLVAWDPVARKPRWEVKYNAGGNGGTLTTAGNLVFQGTADGRLVAYSADQGEKLWEAALGVGVMAAPSTYELDGKQYVTVLAGWGGSNLVGGTNPAGAHKAEGRVWTFVLDGSTPIEPQTSQPRLPLTAVSSGTSAAAVAQGQRLYAEWCSVCHGTGLSSSGSIADLRYSAPATFDAYPRIVLDGAYQSQGMPSFQGWLTADQVSAIRAFVISERVKLVSSSR